MLISGPWCRKKGLGFIGFYSVLLFLLSSFFPEAASLRLLRSKALGFSGHVE